MPFASSRPGIGKIAILSVICLAACGRTEQSSPTPQAAKTGPPVEVSQLPLRRPGVWWMVSSSADIRAPAMGMNLCVDDQRPGGPILNAVSACGSQKFLKNADGTYQFEVVCKVTSKVTTVTKGKVAGDFSQHYDVELEVTTTGEERASANGVRRMKATADYRGPCADAPKSGAPDVWIRNAAG